MLLKIPTDVGDKKNVSSKKCSPRNQANFVGLAAIHEIADRRCDALAMFQFDCGPNLASYGGNFQVWTILGAVV